MFVRCHRSQDIRHPSVLERRATGRQASGHLLDAGLGAIVVCLSYVRCQPRFDLFPFVMLFPRQMHHRSSFAVLFLVVFPALFAAEGGSLPKVLVLFSLTAVVAGVEGKGTEGLGAV